MFVDLDEDHVDIKLCDHKGETNFLTLTFGLGLGEEKKNVILRDFCLLQALA